MKVEVPAGIEASRRPLKPSQAKPLTLWSAVYCIYKELEITNEVFCTKNWR
jgi:hypothetical protein